MKQIQLTDLKLESFRGVKRFVLDPKGNDVAVLGCNGAGKSTLADALWWCLFGKNADGDSKFGVKPIDENNEEIHGLQPTVFVELKVGGEFIDFRRTLKEVWKKPRGQREVVFSGHTTEFEIDGVPVRQKDYQERVADVCGSEETFKLLTSTTYFNSIKWQDRRALVLEISGDVTMEQVFSAHPELAGIQNFLAGKYRIEDYRVMAKKRRKEANDRLVELPVRIDEAEKSKPELPGLTMGLDHLRKDLKAAQDRRAAMLAGDTKHLRDRIAERQEKIREIDTRNRERVDAEANAVQQIEDTRGSKYIKQKKIEGEIDELDRKIKDNEEKLGTLRAEYRETAAEQWQGDGKCSTCGQPLPESMLEQAIANFNRHKAEKKAKNQEAGKALAAKNKELDQCKSGLLDRVAILEQEIDKLAEAVDSSRTVIDYEDTAELQAEITDIQLQIDSAATPDTKTIDAEIKRLENNIEEAEQRKTKLEQIENINKRIEELENEQNSKAKIIEELDRNLALCDEYVKARVDMLEVKVSEKFSPLSFRMFEQQINGGIMETCELLMEGKTYDDLSTGEKVIAGLKVIDVLVDHYGISAPVFVDNSESVTLPLLSDKFQQIFLFAVRTVKTMTVKQNLVEAEAIVEAETETLTNAIN